MAHGDLDLGQCRGTPRGGPRPALAHRRIEHIARGRKCPDRFALVTYLRLGRAHARRALGEQIRAAAAQDLHARTDAGGIAGEIAVAHFGVPGVVLAQHLGNAGAPQHAAVALAGADQLDHVTGFLDALDGGFAAAGDVVHPPRIDRAGGQHLANARGSLQIGLVGRALRLESGRHFERFPSRFAEVVEVVGLVREQLQHARKALDDAEDVVQRMREIGDREQLDQRVAAQQQRRHRVRALIRGAHHHQARLVMLRDRAPQLGMARDHRAHDQPAHRVGRKLDGTLRADPVEHAAHLPCELIGVVLHRLAPVVREQHRLAVIGDRIGPRLVVLGQQRGGLHFLVERQLGDRTAGHLQLVEPHALSVDVEPAAHDARQHEHHRRIRRRCAPCRGDPARGHGSGLNIERLERLASRAVVADQPGAEPLHRARIGEVAQVIDLLGVVERAPRGGAIGPTIHRSGVDDQIVLLAEEPVRGERGEVVENAARLDFARDHREIGAGHHLGPIEHAHQRRYRRLRVQAREFGWVEALLHDRRHQIGEHVGHVAHAGHRIGQPVDQVERDRQPPVEPSRCERGTACRAPHAHEALDLDLLGFEQVAQFFQCVALGEQRLLGRSFGFAGGALEYREVRRTERFGAARDVAPAQQLGHQATARMRDQVHGGAVGQALRELERVVDRAERKRAVLESVDAAFVVFEQLRGFGAIGLGPQAAEAAGGARRSAMDEHQRRLAIGYGGNRLRRDDRVAADDRLLGRTIGRAMSLRRLASIQPRLADELRLDLVGDDGRARAGGDIHRIDFEDAQRLERPAHHAARR